MKRLFAGTSTSSGVNHYSGVVLSSKTEICQLRYVASHLMQQDDPMLDPDFFLASLSEGWQPRVVAVYRKDEVVGIIYAKERTISGIATGIVFVDGSLGGTFLGNPLHRKNSFRFALETLAAAHSIRSVRLRVLPGSDEFEAVKQLTVSGTLDAQYSQIKHNESSLWKYHAHLPLADTYEQFLNRLGKATRHNFRYYRRRFEAAGHSFIERLSMDELRSVTLDLDPKSKFTGQRHHYEIERDLNMVAASHRPLAIGLKHHDGEWVSVIGGWYRPGGAVLCFQRNNDRNFSLDSLSVVLRAYLIELLIRQGLEELVIWSDTGPPLSRYVTYVPTIGVRLDALTYPWRVTRLLMATVGPLLPKRLADAAQWLA